MDQPLGDSNTTKENKKLCSFYTGFNDGIKTRNKLYNFKIFVHMFPPSQHDAENSIWS